MALRFLLALAEHLFVNVSLSSKAFVVGTTRSGRKLFCHDAVSNHGAEWPALSPMQLSLEKVYG
jgi:hypothetical protein